MNPIEAAVAPIKNDAVEFARVRAQNHIDSIIAELEAANWDAEVVAPYPSGIRDSGERYHSKLRKYNQVRSITSSAHSMCRRMGDPEYRVRNAELEQNFIKMWEQMAAQQYDSFVAKLNDKIGEVVSADLNGNHVWSHSILTVVKADGTTEKWKTQMIFKLSKLGKPHNQWPTRKVK